MARITFLPMDVTVDCQPGESIFEAGKRAGVAIETACVGQGTCGLCRVRVIAGAEHLDEYDDVEVKHLGNVYYLTRVRLSCRAHPSGDVTVELAPKRRKRGGGTGGDRVK